MAIGYLVPISFIVVVLLAIVVTSYRQTIFSYPGGGGSYIVSRENLGTDPALVAGASLLVDYTLNVAVSVAAGVAAITSAVAGLRGHQVVLALGLVAVVTVANLRGVKESGRLFAGPVYGYVAAMSALVVYGLYRSLFGHLGRIPVNQAQLAQFTGGKALVGGVTLFLLMRAFASGADALSGVEAISNGVPAFRKPETRNAATTLAWTGMILGGLFFGVALLAGRLHPTLSTSETILSEMGAAVFGRGGPAHIVLQATTAAILCLSANTSFADFPWLSSIIATDGFLPHQLANRGDRLVYSNGILALALAIASAGLLVAFNGDVTALVPLFAVGLFSAFTLSQTGMVVHHWRLRHAGWRRSLAVNGIGAITSALVLAVVVVSKFTEGAWIPTIVIPLIVVGFKAIRPHYSCVRDELDASADLGIPVVHHTVVIPVGRVHRGVLAAVGYAKAMHPDHLVAITVVNDPSEAEAVKAAWRSVDCDVTLEVIESPFRDLTGAVLE
jgi:amino acid transporter